MADRRVAFSGAFGVRTGDSSFSIKNGYARQKFPHGPSFLTAKIGGGLRRGGASFRRRGRYPTVECRQILPARSVFRNSNPLNKYFANPVFGAYWYLARKIIWW